MKIKISPLRFGLVLVTLVLSLLIIGVLQVRIHTSELPLVASLEENKPFKIAVSHTVSFEDEDLFLKAASAYPAQEKDAKLEIKGGIVPHHLLPSFIIADFFSHLSKEDVNTVILVGPNHYERGEANIITSRYAWDTPFGLLQPNETIVDDLERSKLAKVDEAVISQDHSMTAILPFVKYYLPKANVVPLILSGKMKEDTVDVLVKDLGKYMDKKGVVLIASVDFSHYLTNVEAKDKNQESRAAIEKYDYEKIFSFGGEHNEHMDSPPSVAMLLKSMRAVGANAETVLYDTNSGEITGDNLSQVTSYMSSFWEISN